MKRHLRVIKRSLALLYRLSRRYLLALVFCALIAALQPYVPIYFSARLIDALVAGAGGRTLALYAGLTVGLSALLGLGRALAEAQKEIGMEELNRANEWLYAEKAMDLSYASMEDREVALLEERIRTETQTGFNLYYFTACLERLIRFPVQIAASLALTVSFFAVGATPLWTKR